MPYKKLMYAVTKAKMGSWTNITKGLRRYTWTTFCIVSLFSSALE